MSDADKKDAGATGDGGNADNKDAGGRTGWTQADWERFVQSESDRRVTEALKKKEQEYKDLLADKTRTAEEKLKRYEAQLKQERARAEFHAAAQLKGVADVKAAWAVVNQYELIDGETVKWDALKEQHPSLFGAPRPTVAGKPPDTGNNTSKKPDMNRLLRQAVGAQEG